MRLATFPPERQGTWARPALADLAANVSRNMGLYEDDKASIYEYIHVYV